MITEKLSSGLRVLFIGFNPSLRSYERGFNYAGRNNRFYQILSLAGLTDRLCSPEDSATFPEDYGFGFTNVVSRPTRRADEITSAEYRAGAAVLCQRLRALRPRIACYVGRGVYTACVERTRKPGPWGLTSPAIVDGVQDFVAPATSGLVRLSLDEQVRVYRLLSAALAEEPFPRELIP